jgi:hypothetical protein
MRPPLRVIAACIAGSSVAACAALSGLDQITEEACVPNCADASGTPDARTQDGQGTDGTADTGAGLDAGTGRDGDAAAVDALPGRETGSDGALEAGSDSTSGADGAQESGPAGDSAADSPCGTVYLSESFDSSDGGWTLDPTWSIAPTCASPPTPQKGYPDPSVDHTTGTAGGVAGAYVCGNNPSGATSALRYATSPAVDVSAAPAVMLQFYRWLNSDADGWMTSAVDVFDGTSWVNVYTNPSGAGNIVADDAWTYVAYDVTAQKNAAFKVRFGYAVTDAGVYSMSCWNVDDVTISSASCP